MFCLCGDEKYSPETHERTNSLKEALEKIEHSFKHDQFWQLSILRKSFIETANDQMNEASEEDWNMYIKVKFIGEEGVDSGGLGREFYSLLFKNSEVFEGSSFCYNSMLLEENRYKFVGRMVAKAILSGHPGPGHFNSIITDYMLTGNLPQFSKVGNEHITRADAIAAIEAIDKLTKENIHETNEYMDILEKSGFQKQLTMENKTEALTSIRGFYTIYQVMPCILQFMEGLQLHGVFNALKKYPCEARCYLSDSNFPSAESIADFYLPSYSKIDGEKEMEDVIVYNFSKFLKRVQNGKLSTPWINCESEVEQLVVLNTGHILQALLGSPRLPRDVGCGLIFFDHKSLSLPTINTCAPSILFNSLKKLQEYKEFEESMLFIIVGAYGFGAA